MIGDKSPERELGAFDTRSMGNLRGYQQGAVGSAPRSLVRGFGGVGRSREFHRRDWVSGGTSSDEIGTLPQEELAEEFAHERARRCNECISIAWAIECLYHSHVGEAIVVRA